MNGHQQQVTEEMKQFLNEGFRTYAPALVALSEFARQVRSRLQEVLNEFSVPLVDLGISISDLKPYSPKPDDSDLSETSARVGLRKNHGAAMYTAHYAEWSTEEQPGKQLWLTTYVYVGVRADRDRLFRALSQLPLATAEIELERMSDGTIALTYYWEPSRFYALDEGFRTLLQEWIRILTAVGGIKPFLSKEALEVIERS